MAVSIFFNGRGHFVFVCRLWTGGLSAAEFGAVDRPPGFPGGFMAFSMSLYSHRDTKKPGRGEPAGFLRLLPAVVFGDAIGFQGEMDLLREASAFCGGCPSAS